MEGLFERPGGGAGSPWDAADASSVDALVAALRWEARGVRNLTLSLDLAASTPDVDHGDAAPSLAARMAALVAALGSVRFDAAFGRRLRDGTSVVAVLPSRQVDGCPDPPLVRVRTTAPATTIDWKQQVHAACRAVTPDPAPPGPVEVDLRFTLSRRRDWTALWQPALEALGPILGVADASRPYLADVDRVTSLALHRRLDDFIGPDVLVEVWWRPA